ncbi:MAG: cytochrome c3 family protein [Armatimonadota bacterium]|nr:cytochrome c3 family protein [Armatimonadota bacterium]
MKILVVVLAATYAAALGAGPSGNLVDIHKNAKANATKCVGCHGNVTKQKSSNPKIKAFHPLHLGSPLLKLVCVDCHKSVDLRDESAAKLRKQVEPGMCKQCHGPWSSKMSVAMQKMDCVKCHADWKKKMAKATFVNLAKVTGKDCLGCHGGRTLYSGKPVGNGG